MTHPTEPPGIGERIEHLLEELRAAAEPRVRRPGRGAHPAGHRALRRRAGRRHRARRRRGPGAMKALVDDELVASLLLVHGLHPDDLEHRVDVALESVRPFLAQHGGDVELLDIDESGGGVPPPARQLRRLPVVGGDAADGRRAGDRRGRARDRHHRRRRARRCEAAGGRRRRCRSRSCRTPRATTLPRPGAGSCESAPAALDGPRSAIRQCQRPRRSPRPAGERVRAVHRADRRRARPSRRPREPQPDVRVPRLLPAVHLRTAPAAAASAPCPTATWRSRTSGCHPAQWDSAADPGERGVLLHELDARPGRRLLSRARPAPPSRCCRSRPGTSWSAPTPSSAIARARRRGLPGPRRPRARPGAECFLVPIDACYELVGQLRRLWQGFDGGQRGPRRARRLLRRTVQREGASNERRSTSRCWAPGPSPTPRRPRSCSGCGSPRRRARRCTRVALRVPDPHRAAAPALRAGGGGAALELFGETPRWGDTLQARSCGPTSATTVTGFTGETEFDLPVTCTYDFEVAAAKYLHALDDGEVPLVLLFTGTVFSARASRGRRADPVPWHQEAPFRCRSAVWREHDGPLLPEQRLDPAEPRHARRAPAVQGGAGACRRGTRPSSGCSRKRGRTR